MTKIPVNQLQLLAIVKIHQELDELRIRHVSRLFDLLAEPIPDDPQGRTLHAILGDEHPPLLAFLQAKLDRWVLDSNQLTEVGQSLVDDVVARGSTRRTTQGRRGRQTVN